MQPKFYPIVTVVMAVSYWFTLSAGVSEVAVFKKDLPDLVLSEPVQVMMYAGDRFLAANVEAIRGQAAMVENSTGDFRLRVQKAASLLNPCHEDNYWFGNASLSWGGAVSQGMDVLSNASHCRFWDEWPPFFYGFNQNFFYQDVSEAQRALRIAANRNEANKAAFLTYATMVGINQIKNTEIALRMLENEKQLAVSDKQRIMLDKRIVRLQGLYDLRQAQKKYKAKFKKELENINDLIDTGMMKQFPQDPLGLGYEFEDNIFKLREINVQ